MRNKMISFCLVLIVLAALPLTASAQEFDPGQRGTITVSLVSKSGDTPMEGAELSLFHIASVANSAEGEMLYRYTEDFADCGISLEDLGLVTKLDRYVAANSVEALKTVTDSQGTAVWTDLPLGLYFVKQTGKAEGFALCTSFLVTVPLKTEDGFVYHVDATPKTDVTELIDITVQKVWNTDESKPGTDYVTVQLLRHDMIVNTATLSDHNDWQVTYTDMPESDGYRIVEVNVPQGFTATYSRSGYLFTVTNTPVLAQTGQLIWPIPVFAMAGMIFLIIGFIILRKPGKAHA